MPENQIKKNFNIFEVILSAMVASGRTYCSLEKVVKIISRLKDKYPHIQYIARVARGQLWQVTPGVPLGHKLHELYLSTLPEPWVTVTTNTETTAISLVIAPAYIGKVTNMYREKKFKDIPQLSAIYFVPQDAITIATTTLFE